MASFRDRGGRPWYITLSPQKLREVRKAHGIDLTLRESAGKLSRDPALLVNVLHCLLAEQCEAQRMNEVDFARALHNGDSIERAVVALIEEMGKVVE